MSEFKDAMMKQLEEYAQATQPDTPTAKRKKSTNAISFVCEASGIDMMVSRMAGEKCTMMLCIYLSQPNDAGEGTMFIKNMREGTIKEATSDTIVSFFKGAKAQNTDSNIIPTIYPGVHFANVLEALRRPAMMKFIKESIFNTNMIREDGRLPWYLMNSPMSGLANYYSSKGMNGGDYHAKLLRHCASAIAEKEGIRYPDVLAGTCARWDAPYDYIFAFSMLADIYDEPFAMKCFDEYLDNERLDGISCDALYSLFQWVSGRGHNWQEVVANYKEGRAFVILEKNRFWEYLQHAVAVGMGRKLGQYIRLYGDYLSMAMRCDGTIREKYPDNLQVAHDVYDEKFALIREFNDTEKLKARAEIGKAFINQVHDGYELKVLETVNEFLMEAQQNCNCVASYVDRATKGRCWIASFRPIGSAVTQLTIEINPEGRMVQVRGIYNRMPTEKEKGILKKFQATMDERRTGAGAEAEAEA